MIEEPIKDATTIEEMEIRLKAFRQRLYGRCPADASSNSHYLAWCDGVGFAIKHIRKIQEVQQPKI